MMDSENGNAFQSANRPWPETNFKKLINPGLTFLFLLNMTYDAGRLPKKIGALRGADHPQ